MTLVDWATVGGSSASAIAIFVSLWTFRKQKKAETLILLEQRDREIKALKKVFIRECELNNYAINRVREYGALLEEKPKLFRIEVGDSKYSAVFLDENEEYVEQGGPVPKIYNTILYSNLLLAAKLNDELFVKLELACNAVSELEHMITSMIEYSLNKKNNYLLEGLGCYISSHIDEVHDNMNELYKFCSGETLTKTRLR